MVTGFQKVTNELTHFEKATILPMIIESWRRKDPDKEEKILMKDMIKSVNTFCFNNNIYNYRLLKNGEKRPHKKTYHITGPRMRKVIHDIRTSGAIKNLIATSDGYFRSNDPKKIADFIKSCIERSNSFMDVANAMIYHNQLNQ
jgi:hypothetical protein